MGTYLQNRRLAFIASATELFANTKSITFNGTNQRGEIAYDAALYPAQFTRAQWVKFNGTSIDTDGAIYSHWTAAGKFAALFRTSTTNIQIYHGESDGTFVGGTAQTVAGAGLVVGEWYHFAVTADGSYLRLYINGAEAPTKFAYDGTAEDPNDVFYYADNVSSSYLNGSLDGVCAFNTAMTASEIKELMTLRDISQHSLYDSNIIYWLEFEDADVSGAVVTDKSGNGHDFTMTNSPSRTTCIPYPYPYQLNTATSFWENATPFTDGSTSTLAKYGGFGWSFDGTNEYIDVGDIGLTGAWSVSFWIYNRSTASAIYYPLGLSTANSGANGVFIEYGALSDRWGVNDGAAVRTANTNLAENTWYNLILTNDGSGNYSFYVNGAADGTAAGTDISLDDINIGVRPSLFGYTNCIISDVSAFNKELSSTEVLEVYNNHEPRDETKYSLSGNLAGYWRAYNSTNTASGVLDLSGNANHGTMTNMEDADITYEYPREAFDLANGNEGSFDFDGVNESISVSDSDTLSFGDSSTDSPFSLYAWVNLDDATNAPIIAKADTTGTREYIWFSNASDKIQFVLYDSGATPYISKVSDAAITSYEGKWAFLVATYDGSIANTGITIYVNGQSVASTGLDSGTYTAMHNTASKVQIGALRTSLYLNGRMCHSGVVGKELSLCEVQELYNNGSPVDPTAVTFASDIVSHWRMDGTDDPTGTVTDIVGTNDGSAQNMESGDLVTTDYPTN